MADLIERAAAIDCLDSNAFDSYENAVMTLHKIEDIPAVNRWIPCSEKMPDPLQSVLVCTDIRTVTLAWINGNGWYFADTGNGHIEWHELCEVTHWQPLPEPPEGCD